MPKTFYKKFSKVFNSSKKQEGMTLVEVILAFVIISIISVVLIRGTVVAVNTARVDKAKTEALAIANEKIEILKSIDYNLMLITGGEITEDDGGWIFEDYPQLTGSECDVSYEVAWVAGEADSYKQLKVSVFKNPMNLPIEVVTQVYPPVGEEATGGNIFPPPDNLSIESDTGEGESREVALIWEIPDTERDILRYNVYRDSEFLISSLFEYYTDYPGDGDYSYYVTAVYEGERESFPSNTISTGMPVEYPAPQNLIIAGYTGGTGDSRTVWLEWEAPVTELIIIEYRIWRDDIWIFSTADLNYNEVIGTTNHTYVITALYEGEYESEPSDPVTTE